MVEKHQKEEWEMNKKQIAAGREEFKKVIEIVQANQNKQLQIKQDKWVKKWKRISNTCHEWQKQPNDS